MNIVSLFTLRRSSDPSNFCMRLFKHSSALSIKASAIATSLTSGSAFNACATAPVPRPPQPTNATFTSPSTETNRFELAGNLLNNNPAAEILADCSRNPRRFSCFIFSIC